MIRIFLSEECLSYTQEQHTLYPSAMPSENPDISSVNPDPAGIPGTGSPIHRSGSQMLVSSLHKYLSLPGSDYSRPENEHHQNAP